MPKRTPRRRAGQLAVVLASAVTLLVGVVVAVPAASAKPKPSGEPLGAWTDTSSMTTPRFGHTATLLAEGKVLVAGGASCTRGRLPSSAVRWLLRRSSTRPPAPGPQTAA